MLACTTCSAVDGLKIASLHPEQLVKLTVKIMSNVSGMFALFVVSSPSYIMATMTKML